jgi:hypothetical protein
VWTVMEKPFTKITIHGTMVLTITLETYHILFICNLKCHKRGNKKRRKEISQQKIKKILKKKTLTDKIIKIIFNLFSFILSL